MTVRTETGNGLYLYAVIGSADAGQKYDSIGIHDGDVYCIANGPVAAVVGDVPNERIRPERRHLAAHHEVLKRLMQKGIPLPISFGIIADGTEAIERILSLNREAILEQLERVTAKVEMGLRVLWDVPNIFEFLVNTQPELRVSRDRLFRNGREPSHDEKLQIGRLFERVLSADRAAHAEAVVNILRPRCSEIKANRPRTELEVMNLACLVGLDAQKDFEEGVFEAAKLFDNNYSFDFSGPFPPHNFVDIQLEIDR